MAYLKVKKQTFKRGKNSIYNASSWLVVVAIIFSTLAVVLIPKAGATTSGTMKLYLHKENSDVNETYNSMGLTPPEPAADTASALTSTTNVNATPPTSFCESSGNTTDKLNDIGADAASVANRCMATFISAPVGAAISMSTGDAASITGQFWSSESATQAASAMNIYIYRWTSGTTVSSGDRIATLTCAEPGTTATSCVPTAVSPANNITFAAGDRIIAIVSMNVTTLRAGANVQVYYDSTGRAASNIKMSYTVLGNNSSNKPSLTGTLDDDFTTNATTTACNTSGVAYNTKWTCLQGSAASTAGNFNAAATSSPTGDSSSWLWLQNQTTATSAVPCDFDHNASGSCATPSNTFLYQTMPTSYGNGNITAVLNSSAFYDIGTTPTNSGTPYSHSGLVLWTSNSDYLELQVYSDGAINDTGTNKVHVALNTNGTITGAQNLDSATTANTFNNIWLRFVNTAGSWQAQYSTDGASFTNVGSAAAHAIFTRAGLNAYAAIANPVMSYAGAFEWFQSTLASPTYNQTSYQWFSNADSTTPGSTLNGVAQNTATTLTSTGQQFRLRQLIHPTGYVPVSTLINTATVVSGQKSSDNIIVMMGNDGFPRIAYVGTITSGVFFVQCTNSSCSTNTVTTVSASTSVGVGMAIGSDGFARLSFTNTGTPNLFFVQCTNADCSSKVTTNVDSSSANIGRQSALYIGSDGFARITYADTTNSNLRYARCTNDACSTHNITTITSNANGSDISIAKGGDGYPMIAFTKIITTPNFLNFAHCTNDDCTTNVVTQLDSNSIFSTDFLGLAKGSDGYARISYNRSGLRFIQCTNADCSTSNNNLIDSTGAGYGTNNSMVLASDNLPRIAYTSNTSGSVIIYFLQCLSEDCTSNSRSTIKNDGNTHLNVGLALDSSDNYAIGDDDDTNSNQIFITKSAGLFDLQYAALGAFGSCSAISSGNWADIGSSTPVKYYNNATPASNDAISTTGSDPTESGQSVTPMTYQEGNGFVNPSIFGNSVDGEWDMSLYDNSAPGGTTYCLRLAKPDGTALTTYTNYPMITTFTAAPTTDQILRGGEWFSNGSKQPFFWAQ